MTNKNTSRNKSIKLWICGKVHNAARNGWEFQGVFGSKAKAIRAARTAQYFIAPAYLDRTLPDDPQEWAGAYYPKADYSAACQ